MRNSNFLLALVLLIGAAPAHAATEQLAPGLLVDADGGRAFIADAAGFAKSVSLADGSAMWVARETAFPLLHAAGHLIALGRVEVNGIGLVLLLDPATGRVLDRIAFDVPEHVSASVLPSPKGRFSVQAEATPQGARMYWRELAYPLRGAMFGTAEDDPRITEGTFDLVLNAQRNFAIPLRDNMAAPTAQTPDLAITERQPVLGERQFRGMGNGSAMSSTAIPDQRYGALWRWTLLARGATRALQGPALPYAYLPFAVIESALLYRTEPAAWVDDDGRMQQHGTRIVAWDLAAGRARWFVDVLDSEYRGPMPP